MIIKPPNNIQTYPCIEEHPTRSAPAWRAGPASPLGMLSGACRCC